MLLMVQVVDMHKEFTKTECASLLTGLFVGLLGVLRVCANIVFSMQ